MGVLSIAMYVVNGLFWLMGASMLGVGIWMAVDDNEARDAFVVAGVNEDLYWTSVYFMIVTGAFIFVVAFLGMWGASEPKKNRWALYAFIGIVGLVLLFQLNIIILTAIFGDSIDAGVEANMKKYLKTCYVSETNGDEYSVTWNRMQTDYKCCGSSNYTDYVGSVYTSMNSNSVPWTCCVMSSEKKDYVVDDVLNIEQCRIDGNSNNLTSSTSFLYAQGCYPALKDHLVEHSVILLALTVTFFILEISGLILAFILARKGDD